MRCTCVWDLGGTLFRNVIMGREELQPGASGGHQSRCDKWRDGTRDALAHSRARRHCRPGHHAGGGSHAESASVACLQVLKPCRAPRSGALSMIPVDCRTSMKMATFGWVAPCPRSAACSVTPGPTKCNVPPAPAAALFSHLFSLPGTHTLMVVPSPLCWKVRSICCRWVSCGSQ